MATASPGSSPDSDAGLDPDLIRLFDRQGQLALAKENLAESELRRRQEVIRRQLQEDQDRASPTSESDFERRWSQQRNQLQNQVRNLEVETNRLHTICTNRDLDVDGARRPGVTQPNQKSENRVPNRSVPLLSQREPYPYQDPRTGRSFMMSPAGDALLYSDGERRALGPSEQASVQRNIQNAERDRMMRPPQVWSQQQQSNLSQRLGIMVVSNTSHEQTRSIPPSPPPRRDRRDQASASTESCPGDITPPLSGLGPQMTDYRARRSDWFRYGLVFNTLWPERRNAREDDDSNPTSLEHHDMRKQPVRGDNIRSIVRHFVVIRQGNGFCVCLPITTYNGQGVAKAGTVKAEHSIIYTGSAIPSPTRGELPQFGERSMRQPIRVRADERMLMLDPMSRLHYGRPYTLEHNIRAMAFGHVDKDSQSTLEYEYRAVNNMMAPTPSSLPRPLSNRSTQAATRAYTHRRIGEYDSDEESSEEEDEEDEESDE